VSLETYVLRRSWRLPGVGKGGGDRRAVASPEVWVDRSVDPPDGHAHTNIKQGQPLSSCPGPPVTEYSRPPIPSPSEAG
jgi:hypothetical protein